MNDVYQCYAASAFGMEGLVAGELKRTGAGNVSAENGGVCFSASAQELFRLNLLMHFTDRLFIVLYRGPCRSFEQLFTLVQEIDWSSFFSGDESIDVTCKCTRSVLMSPRDCQSITKKSIIEKLRRKTGRQVFPETGSSLPVHLSIRNDEAMIMLNTSGKALSRRGYRTWNGEAPLRETLAAALVELSGWRPGQPLHDPCCGTGTILAEAALMAAGKAPGSDRPFAMESFSCFRKLSLEQIRQTVLSQADISRVSGISGSDIDPEALELARRHMRQAGLGDGTVSLECVPLQELKLEAENGIFICNPPYGERLGDQKQCRALYHDLFLLKGRHPGWRLCAISSDPAFERSFGKKADKKRRLYNGRLECVYYIYN
ncbi:MAG: class I SAM-dependent RNA methyltransferase [Clostridiales bacterium]|nr:class I SAM-dependent RNA methyltransferase [Clostridiales bacterium]